MKAVKKKWKERKRWESCVERKKERKKEKEERTHV